MSYSRHASGLNTYRVRLNNRSHYEGVSLANARRVARTALSIARTRWGREQGNVTIERHIEGGGWEPLFQEEV